MDPKKLIIGQAYFSWGYLDYPMTLPSFECLVFLGNRRHPQTGEDLWVFQDVDSYYRYGHYKTIKDPKKYETYAYDKDTLSLVHDSQEMVENLSQLSKNVAAFLEMEEKRRGKVELKKRLCLLPEYKPDAKKHRNSYFFVVDYLEKVTKKFRAQKRFIIYGKTQKSINDGFNAVVQDYSKKLGGKIEVRLVSSVRVKNETLLRNGRQRFHWDELGECLNESLKSPRFDEGGSTNLPDDMELEDRRYYQSQTGLERMAQMHDHFYFVENLDYQTNEGEGKVVIASSLEEAKYIYINKRGYKFKKDGFVMRFPKIYTTGEP